jgi:hypothetical protein
VGIYQIVPTLNDPGNKLGNYIVTTNGGTLTVSNALLTITASNSSKTYGQTVTFAGTEFGSSGLVNGDSVTSVTLSSGGAAGTAAVGGYDIAPTNAVGSGLTNYTINYANGTLTISPAALTVTANAQNKTYGGADPGLTYQITSGSLVNGGGFSGALSRVTGENVGNYAIQQGTLSAGPNYTLSYTGASMRILRRILVVRADNKSRVYGQTNPVFTVSYSGFVNGESSSVLGGALVCNTGANSTSPIGNYAIAPSGLSSANYTINYAIGTLTITPAASVTLSMNNMMLTGTGDANVTYTIQASSDLVHWQAIGAATAGGNGVFQFQDLHVTNFTACFYRTTLP